MGGRQAELVQGRHRCPHLHVLHPLGGGLDTTNDGPGRARVEGRVGECRRHQVACLRGLAARRRSARTGLDHSSGLDGNERG